MEGGESPNISFTMSPTSLIAIKMYKMNTMYLKFDKLMKMVNFKGTVS